MGLIVYLVAVALGARRWDAAMAPTGLANVEWLSVCAEGRYRPLARRADSAPVGTECRRSFQRTSYEASGATENVRLGCEPVHGRRPKIDYNENSRTT